jgi:hypothetical protein
MRPLVALLAAAALALAGCGGSDGPGDVVAETADKLGEISSGELDLKLLVEPRGVEEGGDIGFELSGPFALPEGDDLPLARIQYTQIAGDQRGGLTVISTKEGAFVEVDGQAYELPAAQSDQLRGAGKALGSDEEDSDNGLQSLDLQDWVEDGKLTEGEDVDRVTGQVDAAAAVEDLLALARRLGADVPESLSDDDLERLEKSVRSSRFELETGADDRLLRRVHVEADFGLDVPERLREILGQVVGAKVVFELGVAKPNAPVQVTAPENALPYSALG